MFNTSLEKTSIKSLNSSSRILTNYYSSISLSYYSLVIGSISLRASNSLLILNINIEKNIFSSFLKFTLKATREIPKILINSFF
jgi:hypothetical protein